MNPRVPSKGVVLDTARAYVAAGVSLIPITPDGSKAPRWQLLPVIPDPKKPDQHKSSWNPFRERMPTGEELARWFGGNNPVGMAAVCGPVSGGLECIDFDDPTLFDPWLKGVEAEISDLAERVAVVKTPGGYHCWYRCEEIEGNQILALDPAAVSKKNPSGKLIETRGEGGYAVLPGGPDAVHRDGVYRWFSEVDGFCGTVTPGERQVMLNAARAFNRKVERRSKMPKADGSDLPPWKDYDRRGPSWSEILEPFGWRLDSGDPDDGRWTRPGKDRGVSATTGRCTGEAGESLLHVFSSSATPLEMGHTYGKFDAVARLRYRGDYQEAARQLRAAGFGEGTMPPKGAPTPGPSAPPSNAPHGSGATPRRLRLSTQSLAEVQVAPVKWLVPGYIPLGKLTLLAGDGGHGKSSFTLHLAACVSRGRPAFGRGYMASYPPSRSLLVSCEDGVEDTIKPRLIAYGADLGLIDQVDGVVDENGERMPFSLAHMEALEDRLRAGPEIRLVVIDPAGSYIGRAGVDEHKDAELRGLLDPLAQLAERYHVAILLVKHLNKNATFKAVQKVGGSVGYVNACRVVWAIGPDLDDGDTKHLLPIKRNLPGVGPGLVFAIRAIPRDEADVILADHVGHLCGSDAAELADQLARIEWLGESAAEPSDVLCGSGPKERTTKLDKAADWLQELLSEYAYPSSEMPAIAKRAGHAWRTVEGAKPQVEGFRVDKSPWGDNKWWWGIGPVNEWKPRPEERS